MLEKKEILTLEVWQNFSNETNKYDWCSYAEVGSEIDEETYDNFLNVLPPITMRFEYFQVGEPTNHIEVEGQLRSLFPTFCKRGNKYFYLGNCFLGDTVDRTN